MFGHGQTNSHRVMNKTFGVEECWSYINYDDFIVEYASYSNTKLKNLSLSLNQSVFDEEFAKCTKKLDMKCSIA